MQVLTSVPPQPYSQPIVNMMETYRGFVRTPQDAIKLFEACRLGHLPRVQRRLSEKERQSIQSGSVFVWDEREAGMRRWTDGKSWSASRVSGSFLTYREMEGKRGGGFGNARRGAGKTPDSSGRGSDEDQDDDEDNGWNMEEMRKETERLREEKERRRLEGLGGQAAIEEGGGDEEEDEAVGVNEVEVNGEGTSSS